MEISVLHLFYEHRSVVLIIEWSFYNLSLSQDVNNGLQQQQLLKEALQQRWQLPLDLPFCRSTVCTERSTHPEGISSLMSHQCKASFTRLMAHSDKVRTENDWLGVAALLSQQLQTNPNLSPTSLSSHSWTWRRSTGRCCTPGFLPHSPSSVSQITISIPPTIIVVGVGAPESIIRKYWNLLCTYQQNILTSALILDNHSTISRYHSCC